MTELLIVMIGGAIGAGLRHLTNVGAMRVAGPNFPFGTLTVNLVGCFLMGVLIAVLARRSGDTQSVRLFLATGVLGGFTTFSAFSLDFATLWERGTMNTALLYAVVSVLGSLAAVFVGLWFVRSVG
ncbi:MULTISPECIES: fluoride efflux transporter CrcB [Mesorhizobium]|uniref:Fluoride-specific ion channel FluC n=1 Tax=Mesorhizobium denitrificans TaxID=2294114 RepID=A0A371XDU4_9HYPH|nr:MULTISPECIES: fluoride efflux transporter CrcB [Mesorhizobium]RFC67405.1 fluoride efflux transporter CrcB [Mesorhizobium denitrificans]